MVFFYTYTKPAHIDTELLFQFRQLGIEAAYIKYDILWLFCSF